MPLDPIKDHDAVARKYVFGGLGARLRVQVEAHDEVVRAVGGNFVFGDEDARRA